MGRRSSVPDSRFTEHSVVYGKQSERRILTELLPGAVTCPTSHRANYLAGCSNGPQLPFGRLLGVGTRYLVEREARSGPVRSGRSGANPVSSAGDPWSRSLFVGTFKDRGRRRRLHQREFPPVGGATSKFDRELAQIDCVFACEPCLADCVLLTVVEYT